MIEQRFSRSSTRLGSSFYLVAVAMLASVFLSSCSVNPATGRPNLVLMTENREKEVGLEEHEKVLASMPVFEDEKLLAYVTEIGNRLVGVSERPDLEFTFTLIDSPEINAFALPGGYVYVNRGLISFTNTEAELAAVIAHEIAHITARHGVQQQARGGLANAASAVGGIVAAVATGSGYIGSQISQVASIWAQAGLSGYGREAELEADSLGAEYLYRAGYEPAAMIEVITTLKNQEDFRRRVTGQGGGYHGLFATHPRNDTRLQQAITNAGQLDSDQVLETDHATFRDHIDGLIVGQSNASQTRDDRNRYYQNLLGYTVVFPPEWQVSETPTTVTATGPGSDSMRVEVQRITENIQPRVFVREKLGITNLQKSEDLNQYRLIGHTGVVESAGGPLQRIAVIYMGPRAYIFRGNIVSDPEADEIDDMLLASIRTFRAVQRGEMVPGNEAKIRYVQASEYFDFTVVAQSSKIADYPEETLRLLNGYYPTGSPEPGAWVKLVE
ncbi:MAG: M48 family metalloprotease [Gammaproteobacteria bacterium]|nr:M48 family metalloprotease [Gammaproteobacteria bacterium]